MIGYWSVTLTEQKQNLDTMHHECSAAVCSIVLLRPYLKDAVFTLRTEQHAFRWDTKPS